MIAAPRTAAIGALASIAAAAISSTAHGCPCRGAAGPGSPLTAPYERWSVQLTPGYRTAIGAFNRRGDYRAFGKREAEHAEEMALSLARRLLTRVELAGTISAGRNTLRAPGYENTAHTLGDALLRAHVDLLDPPMPTMGSVPALGIGALLRAPTGRALGSGGGTASFAATNASAGLGAWETGLSGSVRKYWTPRWETGLVGEIAHRFADERTGAQRQLGPRALGRLTGAFVPSLAAAFGISADVTWEGDVTYTGRVRPGTATRLVNLSAFGVGRFENGCRVGLSTFVSPPIHGLSANASALLGASVIVGWSR